MLTFSSPSVAPSVAGWIGSLAAPLAALFTGAPASSADTGRSEQAFTQRPSMAETDAGFATSSSQCHGQVADELTRATPTYWPCERLNAFILQMAAHGRCVNAAMMLGHRPYARQQLAAAQQLQDDSLRDLAAQLQAYFDAPPDVAAAEALQSVH